MKLKCFTYQLVEGGGGFVQAENLSDAFDRLMDHGIHYGQMAAIYESDQDHFKGERKLKIKNPMGANKVVTEGTYEKPIAITFNNVMHAVGCYAMSRNSYDADVLVDEIAAVLIKGFPDWSVEIEVSKEKVARRLEALEISLGKYQLHDVELTIENATCSLGAYIVTKRNKTIPQALAIIEDAFVVSFPRWTEHIARGVFKAGERLNRMFND